LHDAFCLHQDVGTDTVTVRHRPFEVNH
jgi:hypothetical protein